MNPDISPERTKVFKELHRYIAIEIVELLGGRESIRFGGTELVKILTSRAPKEVLECGEWPKESLHIALAMRGVKPILLALGVKARKAHNGRRAGRKQNFVWSFEKVSFNE